MKPDEQFFVKTEEDEVFVMINDESQDINNMRRQFTAKYPSEQSSSPSQIMNFEAQQNPAIENIEIHDDDNEGYESGETIPEQQIPSTSSAAKKHGGKLTSQMKKKPPVDEDKEEEVEEEYENEEHQRTRRSARQAEKMSKEAPQEILPARNTRKRKAMSTPTSTKRKKLMTTPSNQQYKTKKRRGRKPSKGLKAYNIGVWQE
ncbi:9812_t:CDS:2 [Acaulospora morrowiae]|uniref:9812_t:CDS:1 n=1 Tax=Acaulospora morrowiae TaxID=94023 RepID=A0A9N9FBF0_9GLOM|nr:9812_t:CDS:2 [Acaulospora morrowiae]